MISDYMITNQALAPFFLLKANLLMGMVTLWNMLAHRDEWEELGETKRRQMHVILGRREDGTIMTINNQEMMESAQEDC